MSVDQTATQTNELLLKSVIQNIDENSRLKKEIHSLKTKLGRAKMEILWGKPHYGVY